MRNFPAAFATELAKKTGITPVWILRLTINSVVYDLSDAIFTFPVGMAGGFTTTLPWIAQWGSVRESISGAIGEMLVADFACTVLVDQAATNNIRSLALAYPLEQSPAELYLWLDGLTSATPPQRLFVGYVKDIDLPDETQVHLTIEDESTRFQKYIGTRISSEAYPLCDPDVVGKLIPIVFGTAEKLPALCVDSGWVTSIIADISSDQTIITVSEVPTYQIGNKQITIDDEIMIILAGGNPDPTRYNYALAAHGGVAIGSNPAVPYWISNIINGGRVFPGASSDAWVSSDAASTGLHWLRSTFIYPVAINEVRVYFTPDDYLTNPTEPDINRAGTLYAHANFDVFLLLPDGVNWQKVYGTTTNGRACIIASFAAVNALAVQINLNTIRRDGVNWMVNELEAYGTAVPGGQKTLTVLRGQGGTAAQTHTKGSTVIEKKATPLVYLLADHALDAIGTIYARVRGVNVDITTDVSRYLGTAGNQLAAYPGKAAITIADFAKVAQRIQITLAGTVAGVDGGHTHTAGTLINSTTTSQTATGTSTTLTSKVLTILSTAGYQIASAILHTAAFAAVPGIISSGTMTATVTINVPTGYNFLGWYIQVNGNRVSQLYASTVSNFAAAITLDANSCTGNTVSLVALFWPSPPLTYSASRTFSGFISAAARTVTYSSSGNVSLSNNGANVSILNTLGLTGNSVADIMIGDAVLVNCTRNLSAPLAVVDNLLRTYCNDTSLIQVGTLPATYSLNGAITEYKKAIEWLDYFAFQSRAYFRKIGGISRLIVRDIYPIVNGTIPACMLTSEGIKQLSYKKAPITDVINRVKVLYTRDWSSTAKQSDAYKQSIATTDAASIAIYGEQEQPAMFMFDFVTNPSMANDLAAFYLQFYAVRKWRIGFSTFLDQAVYEFGDSVQLPFANNLVGQLVEAGTVPGDLSRMDSINFIIEAAILPVAPAYALITLLNDEFVTKDGEGIIYV